MQELESYTFSKIREHLRSERYPFRGITELGSTMFYFREPAPDFGVVLHSGNRVRPEVLKMMEVTREERFREEDPYTDQLIQDFPIQLIALDSRFEYDLNWEVERSIYPADKKKWGLQVWKRPLHPDMIAFTHRKYLEFHTLLDLVVDHFLSRYRHLILFDVHSFCYQREKRMNWWEDVKPEINLGTRSINRDYFSSHVDLFLESVSGIRMNGHQLRVTENGVFPGGYLTRKFAVSHHNRVLVLAIEYKKVFMDEWSGELCREKLEFLRQNLLNAREKLLSLRF